MPGGQQTTGTTVQSSAPWSAAEPYLQQNMQMASQLLSGSRGWIPYSGNTVTPMSSQTTGALGQIENLANQGDPLSAASAANAQGILNSGGMSDWQKSALGGAYDVATGNKAISAASDYLTPYARGDYVNGGSPEFLKALDTQAGKLTDDINRSFDLGGRYGSSANIGALANDVGNLRTSAIANEIARQQGLQQQAVGALGQEQAANISNQVGAGGTIFGAGNQAANTAATYAGLAPSIYQSQFAPAERLASVGSAYEGQNQKEIQAAIDNWNAWQQAPWNELAAANAIISGSGSLGGTTTQTASAPTQYNYASPLGGALAGASLGSMVPGIGTGIGALGGGALGLLSLLSDERAKIDMERVGATDEGQPIYSYRYRHMPDGPTFMGVSAQETLGTHPEAVSVRSDGLLSVDYSQVG